MLGLPAAMLHQTSTLSRDNAGRRVGTCLLHNYTYMASPVLPQQNTFHQPLRCVDLAMPTTPPSNPDSPPPIDAQAAADKIQETKSQKDVAQSAVWRLSNVVEKTVDRLSKSVSGTSPSPTSPTSSQAKRVFSLSRKNRAQQLHTDSHGLLTFALC